MKHTSEIVTSRLCLVLRWKNSVLQALNSQRECIISGGEKKKNNNNPIKLRTPKNCKHQNGELDGKFLQTQVVMEISNSKEPMAKLAVYLEFCGCTFPHSPNAVYRIRQLQYSQPQKNMVLCFEKDRFTANRQKLCSFFDCNRALKQTENKNGKEKKKKKQADISATARKIAHDAFR